MAGIIVAGFHRSGTSSVAGLLHRSGISAGHDLMEGTEDNERGYFESWAAVRLHDQIMGDQGVDWATPLEKSVTLDLTDSKKIADYVSKREQAGAAIWCVKDPRIGRFIFDWKRYASDLRTIIVYRDPTASANSLLKRSMKELARSFGTKELASRFAENPDLALQLWVEHNENYLHFHKANRDDSIVAGHAELMAGANLLAAIEKHFAIDIEYEQAPDALDAKLLSNPKQIYVTSRDLRKRVIKVWTKLLEADQLRDPGAPVGESVAALERRLVLDECAAHARIYVLNFLVDETYYFTEASKRSAQSSIHSADKRTQAAESRAESLLAERTALKRRATFSDLRANASKKIGRWQIFLDYMRLRKSGLFDGDWYLSQYDDVKSSNANPLLHFVSNGVWEGCDPGPQFSTTTIFQRMATFSPLE